MAISIPKHKNALTFKRSDLPQIASKNLPDFVQHLRKQGIKSHDTHLPPSRLRATQSEFNTEKVEGMMANKDLPDRPSISSKDGYVLDGHHRWLVDHNRKQKHHTVKIDLSIHDLIKRAHDYHKSFTKDITEGEAYHIQESELHGWIDHEGKWRGSNDKDRTHLDIYMKHLKQHHPAEHDRIMKSFGSNYRQLNGVLTQHAKKRDWLQAYIDKDGYGMISGRKDAFKKHGASVATLKSKYKTSDVSHIFEHII